MMAALGRSGGAACLAETARFELAVAVTRHDGLANRWFQPLTHVSGAWQRRGYSERQLGAQLPSLAWVTAFGRRIDSSHRGWLAGTAAKDSSCGAHWAVTEFRRLA